MKNSISVFEKLCKSSKIGDVAELMADNLPDDFWAQLNIEQLLEIGDHASSEKNVKMLEKIKNAALDKPKNSNQKIKIVTIFWNEEVAIKIFEETDDLGELMLIRDRLSICLSSRSFSKAKEALDKKIKSLIAKEIINGTDNRE